VRVSHDPISSAQSCGLAKQQIAAAKALTWVNSAYAGHQAHRCSAPRETLRQATRSPMMETDEDTARKIARKPGMPPIDVDYTSPDEKIARSAFRVSATAIGVAALVIAALIALFLWWSPTA